MSCWFHWPRLELDLAFIRQLHLLQRLEDTVFIDCVDGLHGNIPPAVTTRNLEFIIAYVTSPFVTIMNTSSSDGSFSAKLWMPTLLAMS